jgi:hypothetical protein
MSRRNYGADREWKAENRQNRGFETGRRLSFIAALIVCELTFFT